MDNHFFQYRAPLFAFEVDFLIQHEFRNPDINRTEIDFRFMYEQVAYHEAWDRYMKQKVKEILT